MQKARVNVGLIGAGRLGTIYAEYLATRIPQARLIAVADLVPERAAACAEKYGLSKCYHSHQELIADRDVDAFVVVATTTNHREIVVDAARTGRPVFCEKPLALSLPEAREMKNAVSKAGGMFQMGFMRRFDKGYRAGKAKIESGAIGSPVVFRGSSRDPYRPSLEYLTPQNSGGQILDMAIHDIDIARWYMGEIASVFAIGGVLAYPEVKQVGDTDNVIMLFTYRSGCLGEIDISRNGVYGYDIRAEVLGTSGTIKVGYLRENPILVMTAAGVTHDVVPYFPERFGQAYVDQLADFVSNVSDQKEPSITVDDGIEGLRVAVAATCSLKTNSQVYVKDF